MIFFCLNEFGLALGLLFGLFWFCLIWFSLVWFCLIWFCLVWFCLDWFCLVWFCLFWFCLIWFCLIWFCLVWFCLDWLGLVWFGSGGYLVLFVSFLLFGSVWLISVLFCFLDLFCLFLFCYIIKCQGVATLQSPPRLKV